MKRFALVIAWLLVCSTANAQWGWNNSGSGVSWGNGVYSVYGNGFSTTWGNGRYSVQSYPTGPVFVPVVPVVPVYRTPYYYQSPTFYNFR